jgi:hypothetical protein
VGGVFFACTDVSCGSPVAIRFWHIAVGLSLLRGHSASSESCEGLLWIVNGRSCESVEVKNLSLTLIDKRGEGKSRLVIGDSLSKLRHSTPRS